jgi:uncharacterized OB-fold protein
MLFTTETLKAMAKGQVVVIRCDACGELHTTAIDARPEIDDEGDLQGEVYYLNGCPACGFTRSRTVELFPSPSLCGYVHRSYKEYQLLSAIN